jgi:hypothetical protein
MLHWTCALELNSQRSIIAGSEKALCDTLSRGADLRVYTEFHHNEHVDTRSDNPELVQEVSDFPTTILVDRRWSAGIMTFRMPINPPEGFGPRPSMSFFLYNQNGRQAIARPFLDGKPVTGTPGPSPLDDHSDMPKYHQFDSWDAQTNAPSSNFVYDFEIYKFLVNDSWREVLATDEHGKPISGSLDQLIHAFTQGCEVKVGISGLCRSLGEGPSHELFVQTGPGYYNTQLKLFTTGTRPIVRVKPAIPMQYQTRGWDFGWLTARTDGRVQLWMCDPYTLQFQKTQEYFPIRWFVR